jgi:pimeloyl-ACP methyl ester carboxylesterase
VRGRESDVISVDGVREFQEVVSHAEFVDVSGAGHMVAGDRNDAFTSAVLGFLDRHDPVYG